MRTTAENAELALLLEVAGTPKPGNVDRHREYPDLRFEHFLAGAVGAREGFARAADGDRPGAAFLTAVEGMSEQRGGNTQFGAVLLLTPLVAAAGRGDLSPAGASRVVAETTVADAADFYRAFEAVDVAIEDPPEGMEPLDVRRGSDAVPALEARDLTLADVMERSADRDGVAREWVGGFERTFEAADALRTGVGGDDEDALRNGPGGDDEDG
ncbi:MAG: triphosphoribosyl-dephospho-CoA synthase, partial [Haloarculaceae archaeon]